MSNDDVRLAKFGQSKFASNVVHRVIYCKYQGIGKYIYCIIVVDVLTGIQQKLRCIRLIYFAGVTRVTQLYS